MKEIKLIMTLLVRDEEDCIRSNIEYHLKQGVDLIIAMDNLSKDNTSEILKQYRDRGKIHYIEERGDNYIQSEWVTRMARLACTTYGADWVINNDADEFWWPENSEQTLKEYLQSLSDDKIALKVKRSNFTKSYIA